MLNKVKNNSCLFYILLILMILILHVFIYNLNSTNGRKLKQITDQINVIEEQKNSLMKRVASASAIATIARKAENYGFIPASHIVSVYGPVPLASLDKLSL